MELMVSGLVVSHSGPMRGAGGGVLAMMEPTQQNLQEKQKLKNEVKRDKNRESSARSRQRKKEEDEHNTQEIDRLTAENEELRRRVKSLSQEGQYILSQIPPSVYSYPRCPGCPEENDENEPCDVTSPSHLSAPPPTDVMDQS